jgi:hypothetical protein
MTTLINASTSSGLVQTADTSGIIKVQSNGVTTNALAWVNFAGTTGTVRASYNVSSVTRASTGLYTVNFATALADANYAVSASAGSGGSVAGFGVASYQAAPTTSAFTLLGISIGSALTDYTYVSAMVFGN